MDLDSTEVSGAVQPGPKLSVIVPLWNEIEIVGETYSQVLSALARSPYSWEVIWVDDGSRDGTFEALRNLAAADPRMRIIRFTRNFGQHPAVMAGFRVARGEYIATIDADLQNPPSCIVTLLEAMGPDDDVVVGIRMERRESLVRRFGSWMANYVLTHFGNLPAEDYGSMLRVYRRGVVDQVLRCREKTLFITALTSWLGYTHRIVVVEQRDRIGGTSKYTLGRLFRRYMDLLVGFSDFPLQLVSGIGLCVAILGIGTSIALAGWRIVYGPGVSGLVLVSAFLVGLGGVQLVALGVLGQYMGRVLQQAYARPMYVVAEMMNFDE